MASSLANTCAAAAPVIECFSSSPAAAYAARTLVDEYMASSPIGTSAMSVSQVAQQVSKGYMTHSDSAQIHVGIDKENTYIRPKSNINTVAPEVFAPTTVHWQRSQRNPQLVYVTLTSAKITAPNVVPAGGTACSKRLVNA